MYRSILFAVALFMGVPATAQSANLAVILSNDRYDVLPDLDSSDAVSRMIQALERENFDVLTITDRSFADGVSELADAQSAMAEADRLLILVSGHLLNDGERTWFLSRDADAPSPFNVGAQGIPMKPLYDALALLPGAAVLFIAEHDVGPRLESGLSPGHAPIDPPQGVTVVQGPPESISQVLAEHVLVPGQSLAEVAASAPEDVSVAGFVSHRLAFLDADGAEPTRRPATPAPVDPLDAAEAREEALALSSEDRRSVQRNLELLGFDPRGIDGIFGPGTRAAITAWQERSDEEATGFLTRTQVSLLSEQGNRRARELEAEAAVRQAELDRRDTAYWRETGELGTEDGLRTYLQRHPDGLYATRAEEALRPFEEQRRAESAEADRRAWDDARAQDSLTAYQSYLGANPEGAFVSEAEERIAALRQAENTEGAQAEEQQVAGNTVVRLLVEQRLTQLGVDPGAVDGTFDEDTRRAIRRFQTARDLPVSGYVTRATMARLLAG